MRTLWVVDIAGGPQRYGGTKPGTSRLDLSAAHRHLHITGQEFDEVARILAETLDHFHIPEKERAEVLGAFSAHKTDIVGDGHSKFTVTARGPDLGWWPNAGCPPVSCPFA
jgi:hemoglobin